MLLIGNNIMSNLTLNCIYSIPVFAMSLCLFVPSAVWRLAGNLWALLNMGLWHKKNHPLPTPTIWQLGSKELEQRTPPSFLSLVLSWEREGRDTKNLGPLITINISWGDCGHGQWLLLTIFPWSPEGEIRRWWIYLLWCDKYWPTPGVCLLVVVVVVPPMRAGPSQFGAVSGGTHSQAVSQSHIDF